MLWKVNNLGVLTSAFRKLEVLVRTLQKNKIEFSVVVSVFLFGFMFYLWIFLRNELIPMIDGPYYLIQVRSFLTTGGLVYGDPPLTFYLLSLFSLLFRDITLGVKVGVSFLCALSTIPAYFLMKRVGKGVLAGLVAMLLVVFSAPYIRMLTDFMKNAVGMCWLFAFMYYLHDLAFTGIRKSSLALAAFFIVLIGLTHILDFGIALVFLVFYTIMVLIFNVNRRSFLKAMGIIALVISAFVFIASTFFSFLFSDFTKVLSFFQDLTAPKGSEVPTPTPSSPGPTPGPRPPWCSNGYIFYSWWLGHNPPDSFSRNHFVSVCLEEEGERGVVTAVSHDNCRFHNVFSAYTKRVVEQVSVNDCCSNCYYSKLWYIQNVEP